MITVSVLLGFTGADWPISAASLKKTANDFEDWSNEIRHFMDNLGDAWRDEIGEMIRQRYTEQVGALLQAAEKARRLAALLEEATSQMMNHRGRLADLKAQAETYSLTVTESGITLPTPAAFWPPTPAQASKVAALCAAFSNSIREVLRAATAHDRNVANRLRAISFDSVEHFDGGPLDLSDSGIIEQVRQSAQGSFGFCALLSPIMALAQANPDWVREHVRWNPETETYEVTLHNPDTGEPYTVRVDPRTLDSRGTDNGQTGEPNFLSIVEQAVRQAHPNMESTSFPEALRILTGQEVQEVRAADTSFDDIREVVERDPPGAAMVATTGAAQPQDLATAPPEKRLVPGHAYQIAGFTEDGEIILRNPWGPDGGRYQVGDPPADYFCPGEVVLTEAEYQAWLNGTALVPNP